MPPSNKPVTLRDLNNNTHGGEPLNGGDGGGGMLPSTDDNANVLSRATQRRDAGLHEICHIPSLSDAAQAKQMLQRVVNEFRPIAQRRGYVVLSVSELCCCNDGLDFCRANGQKKPRKLRQVSHNVWGYNRTISRNGSKVHTIHLRLRHAQDHNRFLSYEDVAGTLAHELSHCEHGPHNDKFYKLMDDILEEHASLMASNYSPSAAGAINNNNDNNNNNNGLPTGFTPFAGQGHALGGNDKSKGSRPTSTPPFMGRGGHALGGDASFTQWMTPREAAVAAALARQRQEKLRLRGNRCCRPCVVTGVSSDDGAEDDEEVQIIDVVPHPPPPEATTAATTTTTTNATLNRKRVPSSKAGSDIENEKPTKRNQFVSTTTQVIDLTSDDDDCKPAATTTSSSSATKWACKMCTFLNDPTTLIESCEMCGTCKT